MSVVHRQQWSRLERERCSVFTAFVSCLTPDWCNPQSYFSTGKRHSASTLNCVWAHNLPSPKKKLYRRICYMNHALPCKIHKNHRRILIHALCTIHKALNLIKVCLYIYIFIYLFIYFNYLGLILLYSVF